MVRPNVATLDHDSASSQPTKSKGTDNHACRQRNRNFLPIAPLNGLQLATVPDGVHGVQTVAVHTRSQKSKRSANRAERVGGQSQSARADNRVSRSMNVTAAVIRDSNCPKGWRGDDGLGLPFAPVQVPLPFPFLFPFPFPFLFS